jgi:hypothetical protein
LVGIDMTIRNTFKKSGTGKNPTGYRNNHTYIAMFKSYFRESANIAHAIELKRLLWNYGDTFERRDLDRDFFGCSYRAHLAKEIKDILYEVFKKDIVQRS